MNAFYIRSEAMYDRLEELRQCVENFPESPAVPVWEREIKEIEEWI